MAALALLSGPVGAGEFLFVGVAILVLFGPRRLPVIARSLGQWLEQLRRTGDQFRRELMNVSPEPQRSATGPHTANHDGEPVHDAGNPGQTDPPAG